MSDSDNTPQQQELDLSEIDLSSTRYQIDTSSITGMPSYTYSTQPSFGNVTINTSNTGYNGTWLTSNGTSNSMWTTSPQYTTIGSSDTSGKLEVTGENADLVINGKSLKQFMETIEGRLAILQPDLEKLEHFAALKKAYDHYKALEALCELPKTEDDNT